MYLIGSVAGEWNECANMLQASGARDLMRIRVVLGPGIRRLGLLGARCMSRLDFRPISSLLWMVRRRFDLRTGRSNVVEAVG